MEFYSKYKSHEEEIMKIANEDKNQYFDSEITIKEEWNNDEDFEDILSPSSENKGSNLSNKVYENWSDFEIGRHKSYKCTKCTKTFEFNKDLLLHIEVTHENKRPFECSKCNLLFYKEDELFIHFCNSSRHKCSMCYLNKYNKTFPTNEDLNWHIEVFHNKKYEKKNNHPQNDIAIAYDTKIPKENKIKKPPSKKTRHADKDLKKVQCLTKKPCEIEIPPMNNKKQHKVKKLTAKKTKPKNTDITFSDKDISCLSEDNQNINEMEIFKKNSKKNKIELKGSKSNEPFKCKFCVKSFSDLINMKIHLKVHAIAMFGKIKP